MNDKKKAEKKAKKARIVLDVALVLWIMSMTLKSAIMIEKNIWAALIFYALIAAGIFCHFQQRYHDGACDAWKKVLDIVRSQPERSHKAIFWTYWEKRRPDAARKQRNVTYSALCQALGIERVWGDDELPDVAEAETSYDVHPYKDNPVECVLDARTIEADSFEKLLSLRDALSSSDSVVHCCLDLRPMTAGLMSKFADDIGEKNEEEKS